MKDSACTIVIATFNRRERLERTLTRLQALAERPPIIVVDDASTDGTGEYIAQKFPAVRVIRLARNSGAAARNRGVDAAATPYVAFCDDDCHWEAGSLALGSALLDRYADVALLNARIVVDATHIDEACTLMANSPLVNRSRCPGTAIGAFLACAAIVRRSAFLEAGGFHARFHLGAEEALLAIDLLDRGWELIYNADLVLHHMPHQADRVPRMRRIAVARNRLWTVWLRHSFVSVVRSTARAARAALRDGESRAAFVAALRGSAWIVFERRPMLPAVERALATLVELPP